MNMNILGALYAGKAGILRAKENIDLRAGRISQVGWNENAQEELGKDLVENEIDKVAVQANTRVIQVGDDIMKEFIKDKIR